MEKNSNYTCLDSLKYSPHNITLFFLLSALERKTNTEQPKADAASVFVPDPTFRDKLMRNQEKKVNYYLTLSKQKELLSVMYNICKDI